MNSFLSISKKRDQRNRVCQSSALLSPTKTLNRDVAPLGDDIDPIGESRADVEMVTDEDEEPLDAEVPRTRKESQESHVSRET